MEKFLRHGGYRASINLETSALGCCQHQSRTVPAGSPPHLTYVSVHWKGEGGGEQTALQIGLLGPGGCIQHFHRDPLYCTAQVHGCGCAWQRERPGNTISSATTICHLKLANGTGYHCREERDMAAGGIGRFFLALLSALPK